MDLYTVFPLRGFLIASLGPFPHECYANAKSLLSCPTLHDPMDCSLPGCSVHGIFQARVLEWGAITFSKGGECAKDIMIDLIRMEFKDFAKYVIYYIPEYEYHSG